MTIYVGEAVTVLGAATNPVDQSVIDDATAEVEFYGPNKNPAKNPDDRTADHGPEPMTYSATVANKDGSFGAYVGYVSTSGWDPGKWAYRVRLSGVYDTWEYGSFTLVP